MCNQHVQLVIYEIKTCGVLKSMASGTPKPDGSQTQNPTVPNGSEPTMVPK